MPDYYPVIRSARYLGVQPWVLAGLPETVGWAAWQQWAAIAQEAELGAQRSLREAHR